jgi:hypothetical protein
LIKWKINSFDVFRFRFLAAFPTKEYFGKIVWLQLQIAMGMGIGEKGVCLTKKYSTGGQCRLSASRLCKKIATTSQWLLAWCPRKIASGGPVNGRRIVEWGKRGIWGWFYWFRNWNFYIEGTISRILEPIINK